VSSVLFVDTMCPGGFSLSTTRERGTGGSELAIVQIATALAKRGHSVVVLSDRQESIPRSDSLSAAKETGVVYGPLRWLEIIPEPDAIVVSRATKVPEGYEETKSIAVLAQDVYVPEYDSNLALLSRGVAQLVCISQWQADGFPFAKRKTVITPILEKPRAGLEKIQGQFIYASAAMKGLPTTLWWWRHLHEAHPEAMGGTELVVTTPGYDEPDLDDIDRTPYARWLGVLPPAEARDAIAQSEGLFYASTMQETFCAIAAVAEAAQTRTHILCLRGRAGLDEALRNKTLVTTSPLDFEQSFLAALERPEDPKWYAADTVDRSPEAIAPLWEQALGLE
jgi:hypothetical protein